MGITLGALGIYAFPLGCSRPGLGCPRSRRAPTLDDLGGRLVSDTVADDSLALKNLDRPELVAAGSLLR